MNNIDESQKTGELGHRLILSIFPGIDLLGMAFERAGYCVVKGPDLIFGGDIRNFHPPAGVFDGVIGGSPCQDFSLLNRNPGTYSHEMLLEYQRIIEATKPNWFLFENVASTPSFQIDGYLQQRFELDLAWFSEFSRLRHFIFGSQSGVLLNPMMGTKGEIRGGAVTGSDNRSFRACCEIQGLPSDFDLPDFTLEGKKQAVGNGVPLHMGEYLAKLIDETIYNIDTLNLDPLRKSIVRRCGCHCGRVVVGNKRYFNATCRKRAQRSREKVRENHACDRAPQNTVTPRSRYFSVV